MTAKYAIPMLVAMATLAGAVLPASAEPIDSTTLYKKKARDCHALDLAAWSHPARKVFDSEKIGLDRVELCNRDIYPIFTVRVPASPMLGVNDRYFGELYDRLTVANGYHSFALVDPAWGVVVMVDIAKKRATVSYEEFDTPPPK